MSTSVHSKLAGPAQDVNSTTGIPGFINSAAGDLHLAEEDALPHSTGVDITEITKIDFDGHPRSPAHSTAGADVRVRDQQ